MSDCVLAYSSFDVPTRVFVLNRVALLMEGTFHPTQKPVILYQWLIDKYAKKGDKILDTHAGSASSLIACHRAGIDGWGFEIDTEYYEQAKERLDRERQQVSMFELI